jgi:hypothetical protein
MQIFFVEFSSTSLSQPTEDVENAPAWSKTRPVFESFPQGFPQACGKPLKLKVLL